MSFPWAEHYAPKHPAMQWLDSRLPLPRLVYNAVGAGYPVPRNLNYFWNFGILGGDVRSARPAHRQGEVDQRVLHGRGQRSRRRQVGR